MRRNMSAKAREKNAWTRGYHEHEFKTTDTDAHESVRAKGALSRKRTMIEGQPADGDPRRSGVVIAIIPCVAIYVLLQKYYMSGFLSGAVK